MALLVFAVLYLGVAAASILVLGPDLIRVEARVAELLARSMGGVNRLATDAAAAIAVLVIDERTARGMFSEGEAVFGRVIAEVAPELRPSGAQELARDVLAVLVGSAVPGLDPESDAVRRRCIDILRAWLVPTVVDHQGFERLMNPRGAVENRTIG